MKNSLPVIGITLGDAGGIGAEIVCKAAASGFLNKYAVPVIIGQEELLKRGMRHSGVTFPYIKVSSPRDADVTKDTIGLIPFGDLAVDRVIIGTESVENGKAQAEELIECIRLCRLGMLDGFCFAPLNKGAMKAAGYNFPSEHEMFAHIYGQKDSFGEANYVNGLWNVRVTSHIPFKDVCAQITVENILEAARLGMRILKQSGVENPRMAISGLNPHNGENGSCGREEIDIIAPAVELANNEGIPLTGPFPADTLFPRLFREKFDMVVTLYHDQGQIAIKLQNFMHCVTVSSGLPHPITTPAHGTAYDIAGTGKCLTTPFEDAFRLCCRMATGSKEADQ